MGCGDDMREGGGKARGVYRGLGGRLRTGDWIAERQICSNGVAVWIKLYVVVGSSVQLLDYASILGAVMQSYNVVQAWLCSIGEIRPLRCSIPVTGLGRL